MASSSHCFLLSCLAFLMAIAAAAQFKVGGSIGWTVPTDPNAMSYNQRASRYRFKVGDSLLFVYPPDSDSVLQVTQEPYNTCNATSYIKRFDDGNTVFTFDHSGPYYFISGDENNCIKNEKLIVIVMADRTKHIDNSNAPPPSMPPSPSPAEDVQPSSPPSPPPTEEVQPSSPPSSPPGEEVPPPPPTIEIQPSPAPADQSTTPPPPPPPPNGASLNVMGIMSTVGAFIASLLVLVF